MRKLRAIAVAISIMSMISMGSAVLAQEPNALEILKKMDAVISGYEDQRMDVEMRVYDIDGSEKSYEFSIWQKGEKRLVRFTSSELKGMSVLSLSRDRVYVYLPGYKRVRRVAAHNMDQAFAGSDFSQDDMATTEWAADHEVELVREDGEYWYLRCTPGPDVQAGYAWAVLKVAKSDYRQWQVEYYKESGELRKTMEMSEVKEFHPGATRFRIVTMTDAATGHRSRLILKDFEVDLGLKESIFSVRQLQWGR